MIPFDKEEWETWREHPITSWLIDEFLQREADNAKQHFVSLAWDKGMLDEKLHASLFERHKVITEIKTLEYTDIEAYIAG